MGLSASQGRLLLLTARQNDLEFRAQQISQKRLILSQQLEEIAMEYENATSNRQMMIQLYLAGNGSASDSEKLTSTQNLTYSALLSGTVTGYSSAATGIQPGADSLDAAYTSNIPYRIVDNDGAIVVSDVSEIPLTVSGSLVTEKASSENGVYTVQKRNSLGDVTSTNYYMGMGTGENGNPSDLANFFANNPNVSKENIKWDQERGMICLKDANGTEHFFKTNGETSNGEGFSAKEGSVLSITDNPESLTTQNYVAGAETTYKLDPATPGADGKITLKDSDDNIIRRYVVDPTLKTGLTDGNGSKTSPNYLQDCLRNGKYLLEKGTPLGDGKLKWNSISWDATGNISDQYYTEDDDKAKAKYDRLQQQIQNQDKKLEIELDNIETQRSAVTTEKESVEKVISENIENSFNTFG